jgi:hypothetical protein
MTHPKCPECGTVLCPSGDKEVCVKKTCSQYGKDPRCASGS